MVVESMVCDRGGGSTLGGGEPVINVPDESEKKTKHDAGRVKPITNVCGDAHKSLSTSEEGFSFT